MEPQDRIGLEQLTKMAFDGVDLSPLRSKLLNQCLLDEDNAGALMDLSAIDQLRGNQELGLLWQTKAFESCRIFRTRSDQNARRKLLVYAADTHIGGNTPVEFLLKGSGFEIMTIYPGDGSTNAYNATDHDVAFYAAPTDLGDATQFFEAVKAQASRSGTKTVNLSAGIVSLDRGHLDDLLSGIEQVCVPKTIQISRDALETFCRDDDNLRTHDTLGGYPFVVRPVGSHAGFGLTKVETPQELITYLSQRNETEFFLSEFKNYISMHDQQYRKYRVVFVDGQPFPCHMAIAQQWDVWYLNAEMQLSPEKRQEEAQFMENFSEDFALRHKAGLQAISDRVGLDYFGIDCAEDMDENLVVFEADNALIVHDMDPEAVFPYKVEPTRALFSAFETMLEKNCRQSKRARSFKFRRSRAQAA